MTLLLKNNEEIEILEHVHMRFTYANKSMFITLPNNNYY